MAAADLDLVTPVPPLRDFRLFTGAGGMTAVWDAAFPTLRLEGAGARGFLQGQTSADLQAAPTGALIQSCWPTATGCASTWNSAWTLMEPMCCFWPANRRRSRRALTG